MIGNSKTEKIFVCYDGDESGQASALKTAYALESREKDVKDRWSCPLVKIPVISSSLISRKISNAH
jgi:hypothetical protein